MGWYDAPILYVVRMMGIVWKRYIQSQSTPDSATTTIAPAPMDGPVADQLCSGDFILQDIIRRNIGITHENKRLREKIAVLEHRLDAEQTAHMHLESVIKLLSSYNKISI